MQLATRPGLCAPVFFDDTADRAYDELPALSCLLGLVVVGLFGAVLVPGPFVFAPADEQGAQIVDRLGARGCQVIAFAE